MGAPPAAGTTSWQSSSASRHHHSMWWNLSVCRRSAAEYASAELRLPPGRLPGLPTSKRSLMGFSRRTGAMPVSTVSATGAAGATSGDAHGLLLEASCSLARLAARLSRRAGAGRAC